MLSPWTYFNTTLYEEAKSIQLTKIRWSEVLVEARIDGRLIQCPIDVLWVSQRDGSEDSEVKLIYSFQYNQMQC